MKKCLLVLCLILCSLVIVWAAGPGFHVIKKLPLGGDGGWDYLTVDDAARRLYVSRSSHVMVVDLESGKQVGDIPNTEGVHGIAIAPEFGRGFTSNGRTNNATIFDLKTLKVLGTAPTGLNPDSIRYDSASKRVFTFNGRGKSATAIDAASGKVVATIELGGSPEFTAADGKGKLYVNIADTNEVVELDAQKMVVTKRFSLKPGIEPSGMAFDTARRLVFSGCDNQIMTILDVNTGKVISTVPIGAGVDGNGFDPSTGFAFSANGEDGTLTVAKEESPGKWVAAETVTTQKGARTMTIDPKTHYIYLPTAEFGPPVPPPAGAPAGARPRPSIIKDSFVILVVGK
ncbi:MAG TPA: YncE family protein [Acidobacteriota bacterium]|nr:YncE family protein [Acidobacteriota bacterium]